MRIPRTLWLSFWGLLALNLTVLGFKVKAANAAGTDARLNHAASSSGPPAAEGVVFYVSTKGNDSWSGRLAEPNSSRTDGPFATLKKARDAVRALMKADGRLDSPVTVLLRSGIYELSEPLILKPEDSGSLEKPVLYSAYPGEAPVLSGGRGVVGWFGPGEAGGVGSQSQVGHQTPNPGALRPVWAANIAEVKAGTWNFHQLFVNGQRRQRARSPNTGFYLVNGQVSPDDPARLKYKAGDVKPSWAAQGNVEVVALMKWAELRLPIKAVDEATHTLTLSQKRQPWGDEQNVRYWIENAYDALDAPGEWYLDRPSGMLFYWILPGDDLAVGRVIAPRLQQLVLFEGGVESGQSVHDITLRGLTFAYTDWSMPAAGYVDTQAAYDTPAAVELIGARNCSIERCLFTHLGQYAVEIHRGSKDIRVVGNEMTDLGAGGVKIGDSKDPNYDDEATRQNVVSNNHIFDIGIVYPAAIGVWVGQSSGNTISHNHIHDTFYTGISVGWTWGYGPTAARENIIEFNHVHHIGRGMLSDMGGIYTLGVQPGTVIRNNLFHDITSHGYGGWGIYTDEGSTNILIENNVVYRTKSGGFHQHYGRENIVRNNIFALAKEGQIIRTRQEPHLSFTFERNIVYWTEGPLLGGRWSDDQYRLDSNLYFQARGEPVRFGDWSLEEWQKRGQDVHSVIADPLFVDPENGDFALKPGSPAAQVGFQPIDLSRVGPE